MEPERHHINSLEEVRDILRETDPSVDLSFVIRETCSLNDARRLWKAVGQGGGDAALENPELLLGKEDAYQVVHQKLRQLRRRVRNLTKVMGAIDASTAHLDQVLADGGPGAPLGFEARVFSSQAAYIDIGELVDDGDLDGHIQEMAALMSGGSPQSPDPEKEEQLTEREALEQRAIAEFNLHYLRVKRRGLAAERNELTNGMDELTARFLTLPTRLGSGSADFVRFVDHSTYAGELTGQ